ncbi:MAG: hypothetical protein GX456_01410 [Verrucomicrobia bacterium]|nr:hypothetical protein [Verrucomicrobiota bacterium]
MNSENSISEQGLRYHEWRGLGLYIVLFVVQTVGVGILLVNAVPLYRVIALDFKSYRPDPEPWWAIVGMVLVQAAYWLRVRLQPPLPRMGHIVLGHIVLFLARLSFVSVTASFTVVFLNRFPDLRNIDFSPFRALLILVMFFSIFCWTLELERLAKALRGRESTT